MKADAAWTRHAASIRAAESWTPKLPPTLQAELRDYQIDGFTWLSRLARWGAGACLADDMGLGKTVQAIAVMLERAEEEACLVVAPTSVCPNWETEIARFAPTLTTHRLAAAGDRAALVAGLGARDVLVCSYGLLHQAAELLLARAWQMAVLDEAQAIKNAETKRAQASVALQAGFRLALTGTPVENYLDELWSLFNLALTQHSCHQPPLWSVEVEPGPTSRSKRPYGFTCPQNRGVDACRSRGVRRPCQAGRARTCWTMRVFT